MPEEFTFVPNPKQQRDMNRGPKDELTFQPHAPRRQRDDDRVTPGESAAGRISDPETGATLDSDGFVEKRQIEDTQKPRFRDWWQRAISAGEDTRRRPVEGPENK